MADESGFGVMRPMARPLRQLVGLALDTDTEARTENGLRRTRCLHCRAHLTVTRDGTPLGTSTLEHIVPRSWFGRRAAADLTRTLTGPDDPGNLAIACARCNQQKGRGPDAAGPANARAHEIVSALMARRRARLR
jgi:5-methylcytosine-specific restriction endonuclease McrA